MRKQNNNNNDIIINNKKKKNKEKTMKRHKCHTEYGCYVIIDASRIIIIIIILYNYNYNDNQIAKFIWHSCQFNCIHCISN